MLGMPVPGESIPGEMSDLGGRGGLFRPYRTL